MEPFSTAFSTSPIASGGAGIPGHMRVDMTPGFAGFSTNSHNLVHPLGPHHGGMAHHAEALMGRRMDGTDGITMTSAFEIDPFSDKGFDSVSHTIHGIQDIASSGAGAARHQLVQWSALIEPKAPDESAYRLNVALSKMSPPSREVYGMIASCMNTPAHIAIVALLDDRHKKELRDLVLQEAMEELGNARGEPTPVCVEILLELARLNLVRLNGIIAVIESFIEKESSRRASFSMLGGIVEQQKMNEHFIKSVRSSKVIMHNLFKVLQNGEAECEYIAIAVSQLLTGQPTVGGGHQSSAISHPVLLQGPVLHQLAPPTTHMQYFGPRDELVTAHIDGTVALWGSPDSTTGLTDTKGTLEMPNNCIPWSMAGPRNGSYMVLSGKPISPSDSVHSHFFQMRKQMKNEIVSPQPHNPLLRILAFNEPSSQWTGGEIIQRPMTAALTAVAALPNSVVCSAESDANNPDSLALQHDIVLFNAGSAQHIRTIGQAHADYTTVLTTCESSASLFFSGSRDTTVRLFDVRAPQANAATLHNKTTANYFQLENTHTDTISAVCTYQNYVFTTSLDGSVLIWDRRRIQVPIATRSFASPVLDAVVLSGGISSSSASLGVVDPLIVAVSTVKGLYLMNCIPSMTALDVIPNRCFTQLLVNEDSSVLFAADTLGISTFFLKK